MKETGWEWNSVKFKDKFQNWKCCFIEASRMDAQDCRVKLACKACYEGITYRLIACIVRGRWYKGLRHCGQTKAALCGAAEECSGKSMLAPWTDSYLIESAGRPMHLFRLSYTSWLSQKSGSPAQLQESDSSARRHWEGEKKEEDGKKKNLEVLRTLRWRSIWLCVSGRSAGPRSLFALQSCVFGCEGNVADVRKTV